MKTLLMSMVLLLAGCSTSQFEGLTLPVVRADVIGTYSAPILVTWSHFYELHADGSAKYEVAYDSFVSLPNDEFQTGHSYVGEWRLASSSEVIVTFPRKDGRIVLFALRSVSVKGRPALVQVSPAETIDGYSGEVALTFFKEPNQALEHNADIRHARCCAPVAPAAVVAHL